MSKTIQFVLMVGAVLISLNFCFVVTFSKLYKKVSQGNVWIRSGAGGTKISFGGIMFVPIFHRLEMMDITAKKIELRHFGDNALRTQDGVYLDAQVGIILRVLPEEDSILTVAKTLGAANASNQEKLEKLFCDLLEEGLATSVRQFTWSEIDDSLEPLKAEYFRRIKDKLFGFEVDDISIGHLARPVDQSEQLGSDKGKVFHS